MDTVGYIYDSSIALDSAGNPHISYIETSPDHALKYAVWNGSAWYIETVDSLADGGLSLVLDSAGNPRIIYGCTGGKLRYAARTGSTWKFTDVVYSGGGIYDLSLGLDNADVPHIAYFDMTKGYEGLKYAELIPSQYYSNWDRQMVDSGVGVGDLSLALDNEGAPHIAYCDMTSYDLKYAIRINSIWWTQTVDSYGDVGLTPSLALDSAGNPCISFLDYTNYRLMYAKWTGAEWYFDTVDSNGGQDSSMVLDSAGNPRISYQGGDSGLKYAVWTGSTWAIETVDSGYNNGYRTSLALDSAGRPHISYCDMTTHDLKYARVNIGVGGGTPPPVAGAPPGGLSGKTGTLYVASYPTGATILVNGTDRGMTDQLVRNITAGTQNLTLTKDGYQQYTTVVNIPAGDVKVLAPITLMKGGPSPGGSGTLYVASYPTGAIVLINGTYYGKTDQFVKNVPAGNQNLTLTKDGYQPYTTIVNVPVGDMKVLAPITLSSIGGNPIVVGQISFQTPIAI